MTTSTHRRAMALILESLAKPAIPPNTCAKCLEPLDSVEMEGTPVWRFGVWCPRCQERERWGG